MKTWLHRISHHAETSYPLLDRGYLTIGYVDIASREFVEKSNANGWEYFEEHFKLKWPEVPRSRHNLWRFICEMKKGDWVLVPSWGVFSLYRIEDESASPINEIDMAGHLATWTDKPIARNEQGILCSEGSVIDLGFFRRVSVIERDISRQDYADSALTSRMKIRPTNADISDLEESVQKALEHYREKRPINLRSKIMEKTAQDILNLIQQFLNPDKFELLLKWYFEKLGASDVTIPPKNERGKQGDADVIAVFEKLKTIYYIQAKFHTGETSDWAAEQIAAYKDNHDRMDDGYSKIAWVITTATDFSQRCKDLAKENRIGLFNGMDVARMLLDAGFENLNFDKAK